MATIIYNKTTDKLIHIRLKFADSYFQRLKGLMFKKNINYALAIKTKYSSAIHTSFMRFPIDVYFIDENKKIFEITTLKPWSKYEPSMNARYILEVKANSLKDKLKKGDEIEFVCENS